MLQNLTLLVSEGFDVGGILVLAYIRMLVADD